MEQGTILVLDFMLVGESRFFPGISLV